MNRQDRDLRLHKAKLSKMIIERPYMKELDSLLPQKLYHPSNVDDLNQMHKLQNEEMDTASSGSYLV